MVEGGEFGDNDHYVPVAQDLHTYLVDTRWTKLLAYADGWLVMSSCQITFKVVGS